MQYVIIKMLGYKLQKYPKTTLIVKISFQSVTCILTLMGCIMSPAISYVNSSNTSKCDCIWTQGL